MTSIIKALVICVAVIGLNGCYSNGPPPPPHGGYGGGYSGVNIYTNPHAHNDPVFRIY